MANQLENGKISNIELAGFRFMLLAWAVSFVLAAIGAYFYINAYLVQGDINSLLSRESACWSKLEQTTPECAVILGQSPQEAAFQRLACTSVLSGSCSEPLREQLKILVDVRNAYFESSAPYFPIGLSVFLFSIVAFYGIRWGVTGRIKPLWLFKK